MMPPFYPKKVSKCITWSQWKQKEESGCYKFYRDHRFCRFLHTRLSFSPSPQTLDHIIKCTNLIQGVLNTSTGLLFVDSWWHISLSNFCHIYPRKHLFVKCAHKWKKKENPFTCFSVQTKKNQVSIQSCAFLHTAFLGKKTNHTINGSNYTVSSSTTTTTSPTYKIKNAHHEGSYRPQKSHFSSFFQHFFLSLLTCWKMQLFLFYVVFSSSYNNTIFWNEELYNNRVLNDWYPKVICFFFLSILVLAPVSWKKWNCIGFVHV